MIKASSLIYAIYICLIIALICGAMLYIANLFNQLNIYYTTHEELYIHNQSLVNYALHNPDSGIPEDEESNNINSMITVKQYGLLSLLVAKSIINSDTVSSIHFTGQKPEKSTCLYLSNINRSLSYSGKVKLVGKKHLPSKYIRDIYINNISNQLEETGTTVLSTGNLPEIKTELLLFLKNKFVPNTTLPFKDSIFFNSFLNSTKIVELPTSTISNIDVRGNFILLSKDSLIIKKTAKLNDVIVISPKIIFEDGFTGSLQAIASKSIVAGENVSLNYPSYLCIYNESLEDSSIKIGKSIYCAGGILMCGFPLMAMESNVTEIAEGGKIIGDIYCKGTLTLNSNVYGTVFTNKFLHKTNTSKYENCISGIEINSSKRPEYFVSFNLFNSEKSSGTIKKLL